MPEPKSVEPRAGWPKCGIGLAFDGCRLRMVALKDHVEHHEARAKTKWHTAAVLLDVAHAEQVKREMESSLPQRLRRAR